MTPLGVRRLLHAAHAIAALVLVATGFLIEWPDLRARVVGGYGRQLASVHNWVGWAFAVAPGLALAVAARPLLADLGRRLGPPDPLTWRNVHIVITLVTSVLLIATGIVLWWPDDLPLALLDASLEVHTWTTWVFAASIPVHLIAARHQIVERTRLLLGGEPPPLFEFADDDPDEDAPREAE
jgi:cytochrome b subunit of formate dehydrogenase